MPLSKKRGSSPEEVHEEWIEPKPKKARISKKAAAKDVGTCSMNKKEIGDSVKSCLAIEKYSISSSRINVRFLQQATGEPRIMLIPAKAYHDLIPERSIGANDVRRENGLGWVIPQHGECGGLGIARRSDHLERVLGYDIGVASEHSYPVHQFIPAIIKVI
ncbi:hypothetical protein LTS10_000209 [Elasticomyces elasticus]|nr:hypothetical protein LTS10_000209 [Elasticomyces elasticus]